MGLRKYAIAFVTAATLFTTGVASAAKIEMTRVQVNGVAVVDSQVSEKIMNAVTGNLGKAIIVIKRTPELVAKHQSAFEMANESVVSNGGGGQKLTKMFRVSIDGTVVLDTQRPELVKSKVKENIGKVDEIVIRPRMAAEEMPASSSSSASTDSSSSTSTTQGPKLLEGANADVYRALEIDSYDGLPTAHQILGVKADASKDEIKTAYHALILKWHPDKNSTDVDLSTRVFTAINDAYKALNSEDEVVAS